MKRHNFLFFFLLSFSGFAHQVQLPSDFGKKQFVVGVDSSIVRADSASANLKNRLHLGQAKKIERVFFTPDYDVRSMLLDLIACEQSFIYMAAFLLTDEQIAHALVEAKQRGVDVQVVADRYCCASRYGKTKILQSGGVALYVYYGLRKDGSRMSNIMHNKFILFGNNILNRSLLWTGSLNFTHSARLKNQENVLLLDSEALIKEYKQQFELLKERCVPFHTVAHTKKEIVHKKRRTKRDRNVQRREVGIDFSGVVHEAANKKS